MKLAILSMQRIVDFGSVLQAYSLRKMISDVTGEKASFIDIDYSDVVKKNTEPVIDNKGISAYRKRGILAGIKRKVFRWLRVLNEKKICRFMKQVLNIDFEDNIRHYDCVIVGSDEVFNNTNKKGLSLQLYGNIKQADKAITYAAAAGGAKIEDIPEKDFDRVKSALSNFSAMSVRDSFTRDYICHLYSGEINQHLDPVLVGPLMKMPRKKVLLKNYMVVYSYNERIRSREEIEVIKGFARRHGLKTLAIGGIQFWCDYYLPMSPFRVLDYFYSARFVITDTFHGTIFSVINKKQFAVLVRNTNRDKLTGLLRDLSLADRIVNDLTKMDYVLESPIDYKKTEQILEEARIQSLEYLKKSI